MHIKRESVLVAFLALSPALGITAAAQSLPPPDPMLALPAAQGPQNAKELAAAVRGMQAEVSAAERCLAEKAALQADLDKKKAELSAEFKGAIPVAFSDLLWQKTSRVEKRRAACMHLHDAAGRTLEELTQAFRHFDLKEPAVKRLKGIYDAQKAKHLRLVPTDKAYHKAPAKKPAGK